MCGITALYRWPDGQSLIRAMTDAVAHRGPDGEGFFHLEHPVPVSIGQRRLSIIDLTERSAQPFVKDGLVLSFNGEIYNFRDLRRELEGHGVRFTSAGDTEVLLESLRRWGTDALRKLRGMFAFVLLDTRSGVLLAARDHMGQKPMFVCERGESVAFASELKAIVRTGIDAEPDPTALVASLMYYWLPEEHCAIKGVRKLAPGSWLELRPDGSKREEKYWQPHVDGLGNREVSVDELRDLIEDSVKHHLIADVPVSTFLSGGLDSSLLTVMAKKHHPEIDAYTIKFRDSDAKAEAMPDDLKYAKVISEKYNVPLNVIEIAPDVVDMWPKLVWSLDEPIGDAAALNTFLICQAARERGVKVLLSGMGADELFGGYRKHYATMLAGQYQRIPQSVRTHLIESTVRRLPVAVGGRGLRAARWSKRFVNFASMPPEAAFRRSYALFGPEDAPSLLGADLQAPVHQLVSEHAAMFDQPHGVDLVNRMCLMDVRMFMVGLNLNYTDRSAMAASCEVRVPFIDVPVAEAALSIPGSRKIEKRERKAVLKHAAEPWLPREVIYRPKGVFSAPLRGWIRGALAPMIDDLVANGSLVQSGFVKKAEVDRMIAADRAGQEDRNKELFQLLTMELWLDALKSSRTSSTSGLSS
jgi:asparagine synthase (glutamine-hydrolysing)